MAFRYLKNEGGKFRKANRPFALVAAMNPPHMPYHLVPRKYIEPRRDDLLLSTPDLYPTLIALMGFAEDIPNIRTSSASE